MAFSKTYGPLSISEANGQVTVAVTGAVAAGGDLAGLVSAQGSASVVLNDVAFAKLILDYIESKLPTSFQGVATDVETAALGALQKL